MTKASGTCENQKTSSGPSQTHDIALTSDFNRSKVCLNKSSIYSKSADMFISVQSTHTAINCGTQSPTNVPHDIAESWGTTTRAL